MMSSQSMQTLIDPRCRNKMPLFDGTTVSAGLSKPQALPGILGKQALQYHGAYFAYDPRGKDGAAFTQAWSKAKTAHVLDGRSPVSHLAGAEGQNHVVYRQDSSSSEEGLSHSSSLCHAPGKQGFAVYARSPGGSGPTAAGNQRTGGESSSPPSESPVYLAVPRPLYRHSPCCSELGCVMAQRYAVERGSPRTPGAVYEHDWMQTRPVQMTAPDALLQQRGPQPDHGAEPAQRLVEAYSPSRARAFPVLIEPNYGGYPCSPTRALFTALSEQSPCLQTPPRGYASFYPPHASYEHMTSEVYQECSPISKYGQLAQHPILYYPQASVELENRAQCKDMSGKQREHVPVILKHTMSNPREHFIVPQSLHGEIPLPAAEALPHRPFLRALDYSCYAVPRFHLNAAQVRHPLKAQHAPPGFHSSGADASPTGQHVDPSAASVAGLPKDKPGAGLHVDQAPSSSPFLHVDRTSPARRTGQSGVSPQGIQGNRFLSPLAGLHLDRPILPPAGVNIDRLIDLNHYEAQITCPKLQRGLPVSPAAWLPRSPCSEGFPSLVTHAASVRKAIYSPPASAADEHGSSMSGSGSAVAKKCLKRSRSQCSPPAKIKEDGDLCEVEPIRKRYKVETESVQGAKNNSPPMPVIDNVFSLAPYQAYLQASSVLLQVRSLQRTVQLAEHREVKPKPDVKENRTDKDGRQAGGTPVPPKSRSDSSSERPVAEMIGPDNIKVEKVEPSDTEDSVETPATEKDGSKIAVKQEPEEAGASDDGLVIKMCEPEELERKPVLDEVSEESNPPELPALMTSPSQGDSNAARDQAAVLQPKPTSPPKTQVSFKNIPPQCLKLSTYKILLPDSKASGPLSPQALVRKHFLELHHSLCTLVSKCVSGSSDQELGTWLAQLRLPEPASSSAKAQKVSCLLGAKAREAWLNEETESALAAVLERLREYTAQERCPFPHVMRAGAVFLPMLVVKELLFPAVPGGFVDQALQERKVELRPTTLSEEKTLIQLHKRACSSRLRRLMSLKHLPDIYGDVLNLYYYSCVCRRLGLDTDDPANREHSCGDNINYLADITASPESQPKDLETASHLNRNTENRVRSSFRYMILDTSLSDEEDCVSAGVLDTFRNHDWGDHQSEETGPVAAEDPSLIPQGATCENSWMCPLSLEEFSSSETETEESSLQTLSPSPGPAKPAARSKSCSGVILKLRRMFSKGLNRKRACYQTVADTEAFPGASLPQTEGEVEVTCDGDLHRASPRAGHKWQRTGSVSHALRPLSSSSKRKRSSLLKIKYCPYLSACHSAEHRRRWVLRSAVQRARRAMRFYYPDLVGKKIHHLYEEDDKSEVWYRGEVMRIHEAHSNPLKTVFEVRYDSEPEWKYYLELLIDYKKGWLKIED